MRTFCDFHKKIALYTNFETNNAEKAKGFNKSQKSPFINVPENLILPPSVVGSGFSQKRSKSLYPDLQCVESALNRTSLTAAFIHINSY